MNWNFLSSMKVKALVTYIASKLKKWHLVWPTLGLLVLCIVIIAYVYSLAEVPLNSQKFSPSAHHYKTFVQSLRENDAVLHKSLPVTDVNINKALVKKNLSYHSRIPPSKCSSTPINHRFDCYPTPDVSKEKCENRGCCWIEVNKDELTIPQRNTSKLSPSYFQDLNQAITLNIPYCFYPPSYSLYNTSEYKLTSIGFKTKMNQIFKSGYPKDIPQLQMEIFYETCSRLRVRITDPNHRRWEPPVPIIHDKMAGCNSENIMYQVKLIEQYGHLVVQRKSNNATIFDMRTSSPLIYSDQFLQISTILPTPFIYGLGEHLDGLLLDLYWKKKIFFNSDQLPIPNSNLYGSHPFYLALENNGFSHGVFLLNSNSMDVILQPTPAITFRTIGGIIDLFVFLGSSPDEVVSQYTELVGRPFLPPYWSLGYHQCRFGYNSIEKLRTVWKRTKDAGIPFDVQWGDIDYMHKQNDFTYDNVSFKGLPEFVDELHNEGMHYIIILDPGISGGEKKGSYPPYDKGLEDDIFVKNSTGQLFIGKVWNPISTVWPDFSLPRTLIYWSDLIQRFRNVLAFDGLWIDMNEPSNFWNGQETGCPKHSDLENPPYLPSVQGNLLSYKTLCMTSKHYIGNHYDAHNLYGLSEAIATYYALDVTQGVEEPFIISRSTFPGIGNYSGHWTGDVKSDWFNLWKSVGGTLTFNILGIPMVGADICGFNGNTTKALCNRWMQLGAFYPFSRNHNTDNAIEQDPVAMGNLVVKSSKKALLERYKLLPYLYTLFYKSHTTGKPVARPLFFRNPADVETYSIDTQFTWGDQLMIVPVLEEKSESVLSYIPEGKWYDWYTGKIISFKGQEYKTLEAPLDTIPLLVSGGAILPCQNPSTTTTESRKNAFGVVVALDSNNRACGELIWRQDVESEFEKWTFKAFSNTIELMPEPADPKPDELILDWVEVYGVMSNVVRVEVNGHETNHSYSAVTKVLKIESMQMKFREPISVLYA